MPLQLTLGNVIRILLRRKFAFLLVFLGIVGATAGYLKVATRYFESSTALLIKIDVQDLASPDLAGAPAAQPTSQDLAKSIINSQIELVQSEDVVRAAIAAVGIDRLYPQIVATSASPEEAMDAAIYRFINRDLDVKVAKETAILKLAFLNPDAELAQAGMTALSEAYRRAQALSIREPRLGFLREQLDSLGKKVDAAQMDMLDYKRRSGIGSLDQERQLVLAQRDAIEQNLNASRALLESAKGRAAALTGQLAKTPASIALTNENDAVLREIGDTRARLSAAEARFQTAQQNYTPGNPLYRDARAQVDLARKDYAAATGASGARIRSGINPVYQAVQTQFEQALSDVAANTSAIGELRRQLTAISERAAAFNAVEAEMFKLQRRLDVATQDYTAYLSRAEAAKISDDLNNADITSVAVIQQPTLPLFPGRPKVMLLMILGVVAGGLAAMACAFMLEMLDDRILLVPQAEALLGLPVLASLPYGRRPLLRLR